MNWSELFKNQRFPSPLIIESESPHSFAQLCASYALCRTLSACGQCAGCKKTTKGFHPDWIHLEDDFKIEDLRSALMGLRQKPFEASYRILSIQNLGPQQIQAQNSLLKTLEEPHPHWIVLIGTQSISQLLPTARSRCLRIRWMIEQGDDWTEGDERLFRAIESSQATEIQTSLESLLKGRDSAYEGFRKLLKKASERKYPGHWKNLAPHLEPALGELQRNLNQKIVWDRVWAQSLV